MSSQAVLMRKHLQEVVVFGFVGGLATLTHYVVALLCVEYLFINIYLANPIAYLTAVSVSFFGHSIFTFKKEVTKQRASKFVVVSLSAFLLSQLLLAFLQLLEFNNHRLDFLIVVFFIPIYTYLLSKFWVYKI